MNQGKNISGFSKLDKNDKIDWIDHTYFGGDGSFTKMVEKYWLQNKEDQSLFDNLSENTLSNFILPFGVAPNFKINGELFVVPMVVEESSVVAAASSAAKYWMSRGGFKAKVINTTKVGHIHFFWHGPPQNLKNSFPFIKEKLLKSTYHLTTKMRERGGGILSIDLLDVTSQEPGYYQLLLKFETCDSMGANFINTILEEIAKQVIKIFKTENSFPEQFREIDILMSILSNYTPDCLVRAEVDCPVNKLIEGDLQRSSELALRFEKAVKIAHLDPYRAVTHNKGIYNGIDAVVIATGNDFRAVEAAGHSYAAKSGTYKSLSSCKIENGRFKFWLDVPLAIGTVGGLTKLHPLANLSLELLKKPSAKKLMQIIASVGLAQNFAAVRSLITTGIQKGHMKMHLMNILRQLKASDIEINAAISYFQDRTISFSEIRSFISNLRSTNEVVNHPLVKKG